MIRRYFILAVLLFITISSFCKELYEGPAKWRASIKREDGNLIYFNFTLQKINNKTVIYILNASERLQVTDVKFDDDSVFIKMPVFESSFKAAIANGKWTGVWIKGTSGKEQELPFEAYPSDKRFDAKDGSSKINVSGRWAVTFDGDKAASSIAEFKQKGNVVTGTFVTPTGDYRFLEGNVTGNTLQLSGFDGGHAFLFTANASQNILKDAVFYSGIRFKQGWKAIKNARAKVSQDEVAMFVKPGEDKLNFTFPDLNGKPVSINDDRFQNKVVIIQLMGSWCPNCMDETAFLSDFYKKTNQKGLEVIALAYEYSTDFNRSKASLQKFKDRFSVDYPILVTGVTVTDSLRTEKTLPQVTPIKVFPSSLILDKKGKIRKIDTGFYGPGTGQHHEAYKKEFYATVYKLMLE